MKDFFKIIHENYNKNTFYIIILVIWAIITLFTIFHHEIWRDAAQVYLICRDMNFLELIKEARVEGHPPFWYFLNFPFIKSGFGIISMQIINWLFVFGALIVFVFLSPFNRLTTTTIVFSSGLLYYFPIIPRNYCLILLPFFALSFLYNKRHEHPYWYAFFLSLLIGSHVFMFGFALCLIFLFCCETFLYIKNDKLKVIEKFKQYKHSFFSSFIMLFCVLSMVLYSFNTQNINPVTKQVVNTNLDISDMMSQILLDAFVTVNPDIMFIIINVALIILIILSLKLNKKLLFILIGSYIFMFYVAVTIAGLVTHRSYCFLLILIFVLWNLIVSCKIPKVKMIINLLTTFIFIFTVPAGLFLSKTDIVGVNSMGKITAEYIKNNIPKNAIIVVNNPYMVTSVIAYSPQYEFWYNEYDKSFTYTLYDRTNVWDNMYSRINLSDFDIEKKYIKNRPVYYLLTQTYLRGLKPQNCIYGCSDKDSTMDVFTDERFYLYKQ